MEMLGHSAIGVTMSTYSHVASELAREAVDRLEAAMWGDS
jgi:integrase